jgi:hypothetical protein
VAALADVLASLDIHLPKLDSSLPYVPSQELLTNFDVYAKSFPDITIVNIVRPDWDVIDLYENYGTHLNISHMGICIKKQAELYFYHATSINERVVKVEKLTDYLTKYLNNKTVAGINILACKF